jgi:hypothetical protein
MAKPGRIAGIDVAEDIAFEERFWKVQRLGWALMAALVVAALAGALGHGPASKASLAAGATTIDFDRVVHHGSATELRVRVDGPDAVRRGELPVAFDAAYLDHMGLQRVVPEPVRSEAARGRVTLVFAAGDGPLHAVLELKPRKAGSLDTGVTVAGRDVGRVAHFVLP